MEIESIKLSVGNQPDTDTTGRGCFMNVIAYLNGDGRITDMSKCVCPFIRPFAVMLNDMADDNQRQRLLPFIFRALGSATYASDVMLRRSRIVLGFAKWGQEYAEESKELAGNDFGFVKMEVEHFAKRTDSAANAAKSAEKYVADYADYAYYAHRVASLASSAIYYAGQAASFFAADNVVREKIFSRGLRFLDAALPQVCPLPEQCIIDRVNKIVEMQMRIPYAG